MDLFMLKPITYHTIASLITLFALRQPKRYRLLSLGPISLFTILALTSAHQLPWIIGINVTFASLMVYYIPYTVKILILEVQFVHPEAKEVARSWIDCYRAWNNPRCLPRRPFFLDKSNSCSTRSRVLFTVKRVAKAAVLWAIDSFLVQGILVSTLAHLGPHDFAPDMEWISPMKVFILSSQQLRLRALISVQWIWSAYYFNNMLHCALSIVAVLSYLDHPADWPPLFGSLLLASSIRGFWGRFWHRLTTPLYVFYARLIIRSLLNIRPGSRTEKTLVPFLIFTASGISHCVVGYSLGDVALMRDVYFFEANFLAAALETFVGKTPFAAAFIKRFPLLRRVLGFIWVFTFFFIVAPPWLYPKFHHAFIVASTHGR